MKKTTQELVIKCYPWGKFICNRNDTGNLVPQIRSECIWCLWKKYFSSLKLTAKLIEACGSGKMRVQHFRKWCIIFETAAEIGFVETKNHNWRSIYCTGIVQLNMLVNYCCLNSPTYTAMELP